jgi:GT2 family glycosyltransferase
MLTHNDLSTTKNSISRLVSILGNDLFEELIILDNGSTDGTREYLESLRCNNKILLILSDTNIGVASGRRRLFRQAQGDIVASLDNDVLVNGLGYFERAKKLLYGDQSVGICGASGYRAKLANGHLYLTPWNKNLGVDCVSGFCQIFRRAILSEIRISMEFSPFWCEDTDFCFQAINKGFTIRHLDPGIDLIHTYRSIHKRQNDPRKFRHEQLLAKKWEGRISLLGESRLLAARNRLQPAISAIRVAMSIYVQLSSRAYRNLQSYLKNLSNQMGSD